MNYRSFRSLKCEGTAKPHQQYADQLTIYAHALRQQGFKINQLAIVALNKQQEQLRVIHQLLPVRAGEVRGTQGTH